MAPENGKETACHPLILAVDDEPYILELIKECLDRLNFVCHTARNGYEALELLAREKYFLVITDIQMPGMDGVELLKQIRRSWPDQEVIVISGFFTDYNYAEILASGAYNFLEKPFVPRELEAMILQLAREQNTRPSASPQSEGGVSQPGGAPATTE